MRKPDRILAIRVWGEYGNFRNFEATTSHLSFPFPPPTSIAGFLAAILGITNLNNEYLRVFSPQNTRIAVRLLNPVRTISTTFNNLSTVNSNIYLNERVQIPTELLVKPDYIYYVYHESPDIMEKLEYKVKNHAYTYPVYLGKNSYFAEFEFAGLYDVETVEENDFVEVVTPTKMEEIKDIQYSDDKKYSMVTMPIIMRPEDRVVEKYSKVLWELNAKPLKIKVKKGFLYRIKNEDKYEYITFLL